MTTLEDNQRVAFLGLGAMGIEMASVLLQAGVRVTVWNRNAEKAKKLLSSGARAAPTPAQAVADANIVITMLANDEALESVMLGPDGVLDAMLPGALHISMSTISALGSEHLEAHHRKRGLAFISAPVFGRPQAAANGALFIVAAGESAALERAETVFSLLGQRSFIVGDTPAQANAMKLAGNFMIMAAAEATGEAMAVAAKAGIEPAIVQEVITGTIFDAPIYHAYGEMLVERRFTPAGFTAELGLKDMRLFDELAEAGRVPTPFLGVLRDRLRTVINRHGPHTDWAAVGAIAREDSESAD
ncbi:MAG: 3-hydroxyisobutyrate dehydrogenase-like beta-hydroxyacid dehydrogenase [Halieaceae bacterium]